MPRYTILVPLYREAAVVEGLLSALDGLDYPQHKLEMKLLVEVDDLETIDALHAAEPAPNFEVLRVPPGKRRTKAKACNFGLRHARGDLVVIFDAEDHPEPELGVVKAFLQPPALAVVAGTFALSTAARMWAHAAGLRRSGYRDLVPYCVLFPAYRLLRSVAAWKGLSQLVTRPSYWEKTVHGLDAPRRAGASGAAPQDSSRKPTG